MSSSAEETTASPWRLVAGVFLGAEGLWWAVNAVVSAGAYPQSIGSELLIVIPVTFMVLTLLAIFLLVQAPRGGIWLGLGLQVLMLAEAVAFALISSLALLITVPLAIVTALCLAVAWPKSSAR